MHKILELIEGVDVDDTETLDEIDARVDCWLHNNEFRCIDTNGWFEYVYHRCDAGNCIKADVKEIVQYSRDRNALKAIRPNDFMYYQISHELDLCFHNSETGEAKTCDMYNVIVDIPEIKIKTPWLPTEELAELHAIIQTIAWERSQC